MPTEPLTVVDGPQVVRVVAAVAAVVLLLILQPWQIEFHPGEELIAESNTLAIMYFEDLSAGEENSRLGEIITNLLITDLSESRFVRVISAQRVYDILQQMEPPEGTVIDRDIASGVAEAAGAKWMLLGSVMRDAGATVLTSHLVDVRSGTAEASQKVEGRPDESVFSLVDRLTVQVKNDLMLPDSAQVEPDPPVAEITTHSPEAYRLYLEGLDHYKRLYNEEAQRAWREALGYDSTFAMVYYRLSFVAGIGNLNLALKYLNNATQKDQMFIKSKAAMYLENSCVDAERYLLEIVDRCPDDKEAYFELGRLMWTIRQVEKAIGYFEKVLELDPLHKLSYNMLAYGYERQGEFERAIWAANKYIEVAPGEPNPYDSRAEIYARNGKLDEAIESYRLALEIRPSSFNSLMYLGFMYIFNGDYAQADSCFNALLEIAGPRQKSLVRMYQAYIPVHQGKFNQALEKLDQGIAADWANSTQSQSRYKFLLKAFLLSETGRCDLAEQALREMHAAVEDTAGPRPLLCYEVDVFTNCGRLNEARALGDSVRLWADAGLCAITSWHHTEGHVALQDRLPDSAIALLERVDWETSDFAAGYFLGRAYLDAGRLGEAVSTFEQLQTRYNSPRMCLAHLSVKTHYYLGIAYERSGWTRQAVDQYRTFLEIWQNADPGIAEIEDARERLDRLEKSS